ncbi:protein of unknown function [Denitratisoma oestradiolicum]|uniref:Uncharacterized protein n=1 Tax=Denitratisoma oestradiolicum TaxID=311182 RepID=A0A6S6XWG7_9PROT|nr:protein of unknown function [Denitratisoma oestradiolicum]
MPRLTFHIRLPMIDWTSGYVAPPRRGFPFSVTPRPSPSNFHSRNISRAKLWNLPIR